MTRDLMPPTTDQSLPLRALDILRRRRLLAFVVFAGVVSGAASFALHLPDLYKATAMVVVERQVAEAFVRPAVTGELESRLHVIKQEILSRDRLSAIVNRFNLYPELRAKGSLEDVVEQTRRDIQVDQSGPEQVTGRTKTVAFRLSYTGPTRQTVADVTNAIAAFYVAQNDRIRTEEATNTTEFLKTQLGEAKRNLDVQEGNMRAYMARHAGELPQQVEVNLATLERLNTQLRLNGERQIRTLEQRQKQQGDLEAFEIGASAPGAALPANAPPDVQLDKLRKDLANMETKYRDKHPDVLRLKSEIAALERESAEQRIADAKPEAADAPKPTPHIRKANLDALDGEIDKLKKEETELRGAIAGVEKRLEVVPERQQDLGQISRDHSSAKDQYESLMKRYSEAQLAESMETDRQGERFRVVEAAVIPEGPAAPNRPQLLVLSALLAFFAAVLAMLIAEQMDTTFHSIDEIRDFTRVPVLVTIPAIPSGLGHRAVRIAMATACIIAALALVATVSAHFAQHNEELVRILSRVA